MAYAAMDIARYVINYCIDKGRPISNLQLQKILYYIQAAFLLEKNEPCFDDVILRWRHGPVIVDVYNKFSRFIGETIDERQDYYIEYEYNYNMEIKAIKKVFDPDIIKEEDKAIINKVVNGLMYINPWELVKRTHEEDPWKNADPNEEIPIESIRNYFNKDKHGDRIYGKF